MNEIDGGRPTDPLLPRIQVPTVPAWQAHLQLRFARQGPRSVAIHKQHHGPLRVQRLLYPEGPACCHVLLLHPPGGIAGGDRLAIEVELQADAHVLLTTPGSGKWYRSVYGRAYQSIRLQVAAGACLEWLPQESLLFDGAHVEQDLQQIGRAHV